MKQTHFLFYITGHAMGVSVWGDSIAGLVGNVCVFVGEGLDRRAIAGFHESIVDSVKILGDDCKMVNLYTKEGGYSEVSA